MFIHDNKIALRATEPGDIEQIYRWENDRTLWQVSETISPYSHYQIEQFIINNVDLFAARQMRLMICLDDNTAPIGCIDIFDFDPIHQRVAIGILIQESYRHQGHASAAITLLIEYLFNTLFLKQVYCFVDEKNTDSLSLFSRLGFVQCGRRKEWIKTPEGFIDEIELQYINPRYQL